MRTLRDGIGKTQVQIADATGMDQADISRLENRADLDDCQVVTLRRYVEALGGKLELTATFGNKKVVLAGAEPTS